MFCLIFNFILQPAAHGFFSYSDTIASALLSLGKSTKELKLTKSYFMCLISTFFLYTQLKLNKKQNMINTKNLTNIPTVYSNQSNNKKMYFFLQLYRKYL
jgi:hypothetical protein